jgi:molybdopterin-guanine dinucleotide biosynthesis protein B
VAIATDAPQNLPQATMLAVLDLNDAPSVARYLIENAQRFDYNPDNYAL